MSEHFSPLAWIIAVGIPFVGGWLYARHKRKGPH